MLFFVWSQSIDDISETTQTLVNVFRLLQLHTLAPCLAHFLRPSQVYKIQLTLLAWVLLVVPLHDVDDEERVASGAPLIHASEGYLSVGRASVHGLEHLFAGAYADFGAILDEDAPVLILFNLQSGLGRYIIKFNTYDPVNQTAFRCIFRHRSILWRIRGSSHSPK